MALITEAAARDKWCPHARASDLEPLPISINRRGRAADPDCLCLASNCMAWRWESYRGKDVGSGDEKRGFCGAFGIPMESIV